MNHKTTETRNRQSGSHSTINAATPKQLSQFIRKSNENKLSPEDLTKIANRLLASILVYYKETFANASASPLSFDFKEVFSLYNEKKSIQFTQFISADCSSLERQSADIASTPVSDLSNLSCIDVVFYSIVNLTRSESNFAASIEFNASSALSVIIASVVEGARTHDLERLIILCMFLKDSESCYPLQSFAISACLEIIGEHSVPYFARTAILKIILGPAEFILHHLESRIRLSTSISNLLQHDLCRDIEFRAVLLRIAKNIGISKPKSHHEQQKIRLYNYLELLILDPAQYTCTDKITSYMTVDQWSSVLNCDFVLYLYLTEYKYQIAGFLESLNVIGIKFVLFSPSTIQLQVIGEGEYNQEITLYLSTVYHQIYKPLSESLGSCKVVPAQYEKYMDAAAQIIFENTSSDSAIQSRLVMTQDLVYQRLIHFSEQIFLNNLEQLLNVNTLILHSISIIPSRLLIRILWMTAINLRVFNKLRLAKPQYEMKICEGLAVCMDVYISCIGRNENVQQSNISSNTEVTSANRVDQNWYSENDLPIFLTSFMLLFPVDDSLVWCYRVSHPCDGASKPNVCAIFIFRIFEQLVPHLESLVKFERVTPNLVLIRFLLRLLSIQVPSNTIIQDYLGFKNALNNIADLYSNSTLSKSLVWQELFDMSHCPHPFPELETRLGAILTKIIKNK